ncbi:MAG: site-specific integrase [Gammaproteobacteria bacterium]|nr:site-specific integrase [Gammaproteobacteria bacterium]
MARSQRSVKLETRTARLKLPIGSRNFVTICEGVALGYRRTGEGFGTWQARIWDGTQYHYRKLGVADDHRDTNGVDVLSFIQAQDLARAFIEEITNPKVTLRPVTVAEAVERYLKWYREHRRAYKETETTIKAHILPHFNNRLITEISTHEIRHWHNTLAAQPARVRVRTGAKPAYKDKPVTEGQKRSRKSTANRILTVLKAILNKAFQDELIPDNAAWRRVKPFANADEPITRFLTEAECTRLINTCRPDFRQLVKSALFTGARYSELARLCVADVNTDTGMIYVSPEAKSGRGRHVPLSAEGLDFFKSQIAGRSGKEPVFTREDGTPWGKNHYSRLLKQSCAIAKIEPEIGFHELRHTYASLLAQAGADLLTISKLLGHSDTRITSRHYAHLCDQTLKNAVQTLLPSFGHKSASKVQAIR